MLSHQDPGRTACLHRWWLGRAAAPRPPSPQEKWPSPRECPLSQKPKSQASRAEQSYGGDWGRFLLTQKRWGSKRTWRRNKRVTNRKGRRLEQLTSEWAPSKKETRSREQLFQLYGNSMAEAGKITQECEETWDLVLENTVQAGTDKAWTSGPNHRKPRLQVWVTRSAAIWMVAIKCEKI